MEEAERLDAILADWEACRDRGESVDPEDLIRAHPHLAEQLRERLAGIAERSNDPPSSATALLEKLSRGERPSYTRKGEIARGGMGAILRIRDEALRRDLAMKVVLEERGGGEADSDSAYVHRFLEEAQVTAQLDHPGVVPVHELGVDQDGQVFFTMKLVEGRTLGDIFGLVKEGKEDWNLTRAIQLFVRVCETLAFAHSKGVIHRDLKPANIMVGDFGEVYVMDWGLAKVLGEHAEPTEQEDDKRSLVVSERAIEAGTTDSPQMTQAGAVIGTPAYMPIEQATGQGLDARSDVYAIGAMLYELLTGHSPYGEPEEKRNIRDVLLALMAGPCAGVQERAPKLPGEIIAITEKAMAREPIARYQTAAELGQDLRHFIEGRVVRAYRTGPLVELKKWVLRNRALAGAIGAAVALLVGGLVIAMQRTAERERALGEKDEALRRARALALSSASADASSNPMRALLLAREAGRNWLLPEVVTQLHTAIQASPERVIFRGHTDAVWSAVFSPSGDRILTRSEDKTARLWDLAGNELAVFEHQGEVLSAVFSASGDRVLTASEDKTARLWDIDGSEHAVLRGHEGVVRSAAFSPSGDRILTRSEDKTARLWDIGGKELAVLPHEARVSLAVFSPSGDRILTRASYVRIWDRDGNQLAVVPEKIGWRGSTAFSPSGDRVLTATGRRDKTARLWDLDGKELRVLPHEGEVSSAVFSPSGDRILTVSEDRIARLWDLDGSVCAVLPHTQTIWSTVFSPSGDKVLTVTLDRRSRLWDIEGIEPGSSTTLDPARAVPLGSSGRNAAFSPSGDRILTASTGATAQLWSAAGKKLVAFRHESHLLSAVLSPSGGRVLTTAADNTARLWDFEGRELAVLRGHRGPLWSPVFSPSGDRILTYSDHETARLWDPRGKVLAVLDGHKKQVRSAVFSPSGVWILTASADNTARLWDLEGQAGPVLEGHEGQVRTAVFSPLGDRILTSSDDKTARLWDLKGKELDAFKHTSRVWSPVFSPGSDRILTYAGDKTVRLWDLEGKERILRGHTGAVWSAAFSPSGDRILTRSGDKTARLWDLDGEELRVLPHEAEVGSAVFSPSGDRILTRSGDVRLWDLDGNKLATLPGGENGIASAVFVPSGDRILTVSDYETTARLWDVDGEELALLQGHEGFIQSVAFAPPGDRILTGSTDKTARLWDLDGNELAVLRGHGRSVKSVSFSPSGDRIITLSDDDTARVWLARGKDLLKLAEERVSREFTPEERRRYAGLLPDATSEDR